MREGSVDQEQGGHVTGFLDPKPLQQLGQGRLSGWNHGVKELMRSARVFLLIFDGFMVFNKYRIKCTLQELTKRLFVHFDQSAAWTAGKTDCEKS